MPETVLNKNANIECDMLRGPCACGATHQQELIERAEFILHKQSRQILKSRF